MVAFVNNFYERVEIYVWLEQNIGFGSLKLIRCWNIFCGFCIITNSHTKKKIYADE